MDWTEKASNILRAEVKLRGFTYGELAVKLQSMGLNETESSVRSKMSRGTFNFTFFLQCLEAMSVKEIRLNLKKK